MPSINKHRAIFGAVTGLLLTVVFAHNTALAGRQRTIQLGYFIISNAVDKDNREVRILLNQEFFSEQLLRELLSEFSEKYSEPDRLDIYLYSNLEQTRGFVNGSPHHGLSLYLDKQDPGSRRRYAYGLAFRRDGNEVIRYYVPSGKDPELETVVVKGRDPAYSSEK